MVGGMVMKGGCCDAGPPRRVSVSPPFRIGVPFCVCSVTLVEERGVWCCGVAHLRGLGPVFLALPHFPCVVLAPHLSSLPLSPFPSLCSPLRHCLFSVCVL